jgi:hypothetical protein
VSVFPEGFKLFGREPAFFVGVIEAVLVLLLSFGIPGLDQDTVGVIMAAVVATLGLVAAYATKTTLYSALVGFAKAALVLAATFGLPLTDAQIAAVLAVVAVTASGWLREKTNSIDTVISNASPGAGVPVVATVNVPPNFDVANAVRADLKQPRVHRW